jgi:mannose-6-phosphate isomerase
MHLFEAALAWAEAGGDPTWRALADEIAALALDRFIDARGALHEFFAAEWELAPGVDGRIVEPGHQFEWAWLLLRWGAAAGRAEPADAAKRMIDIGEGQGVDPARNVAMNALLDDFSVHDAGARLWPQTERIKAGALGGAHTGEDRFWRIAAQGAAGLQPYLDTPVRGLWRDRLLSDGRFVEEAAPASSFYHIVCAIADLQARLRAGRTTSPS